MCITSLAFDRIAKKHIFFVSKDELISVRIIYKCKWKRKKIEEKRCCKKTFLNVSFATATELMSTKKFTLQNL